MNNVQNALGFYCHRDERPTRRTCDVCACVRVQSCSRARSNASFAFACTLCSLLCSLCLVRDAQYFIYAPCVRACERVPALLHESNDDVVVHIRTLLYAVCCMLYACCALCSELARFVVYIVFVCVVCVCVHTISNVLLHSIRYLYALAARCACALRAASSIQRARVLLPFTLLQSNQTIIPSWSP